ncbi:NAD(P)/FAD-dependent oxidoreductase [Cytophaga hutchinsonii]|uniref:Alkyl hydroperoxide reductase, F52a subunit n=1 Tax=Cytophaga hutchinsonii (strain ATCC 33406 / DSM 1761 / CIP 103989 / NBRC 15051 / NCIMB 9469 / D465) TaxID=269798 RepID=A0A6N4STW9_CYTH3|nr:NAD(P)/FAD-dependent oxidoreductase [Cytophaga hutchinsonii]ABG59825.1 alkyl hydroperoxide reductase, F52a subunit [Cytophaga hutchinsonii ATCC 33406]SFX29195.1 Thioredoxin reductase [Cytophaga hutchinsonii ATCC 33406]
MAHKNRFDVIIIGGSYSGLSAAMSLARSLRKVLIIDSGKPCNRQTPHSHNFITHDGHTPKQISEAAKQQVLSYDTITFYNGLAVNGEKTDTGFMVKTENGDSFTSKKLVIATGVRDLMPAYKGFADCWGISVLHCPYCHGYEVHGKTIGLLGNGNIGFEFCKLISNWTKDLILFTDGKSTLTYEQTRKVQEHNIKIVEKEIAEFIHENGYVKYVLFKDGTQHAVTALFARIPFEQHCAVPAQLGCTLNEDGLIKTDEFNKTSVPGVYAAGDNSSPMRAVAAAVAAGSKAGAVLNREMIEEAF